MGEHLARLYQSEGVIDGLHTDGDLLSTGNSELPRPFLPDAHKI